MSTILRYVTSLLSVCGFLPAVKPSSPPSSPHGQHGSVGNIGLAASPAPIHAAVATVDSEMTGSPFRKNEQQLERHRRGADGRWIFHTSLPMEAG